MDRIYIKKLYQKEYFALCDALKDGEIDHVTVIADYEWHDTYLSLDEFTRLVAESETFAACIRREYHYQVGGLEALTADDDYTEETAYSRDSFIDLIGAIEEEDDDADDDDEEEEQ